MKKFSKMLDDLIKLQYSASDKGILFACEVIEDGAKYGLTTKDAILVLREMVKAHDEISEADDEEKERIAEDLIRKIKVRRSQDLN